MSTPVTVQVSSVEDAIRALCDSPSTRGGGGSESKGGEVDRCVALSLGPTKITMSLVCTSTEAVSGADSDWIRRSVKRIERGGVPDVSLRWEGGALRMERDGDSVPTRTPIIERDPFEAEGASLSQASTVLEPTWATSLSQESDFGSVGEPGAAARPESMPPPLPRDTTASLEELLALSSLPSLTGSHSFSSALGDRYLEHDDALGGSLPC